MIIRLLACLTLLIASSAQAIECSPAKTDFWLQEARHANTNGNWSSAREALGKLSQCHPLRGDLRIESLRLALLDGDRQAALEHRQWLRENNIPPALARLVDTWLAASGPAPLVAAGSRQELGFLLTRGYDSNANDGSRHDSILVNFNGLPLDWNLDTASQARSSSYSALNLNWQYQGERNWHLGGSARHYDNLQETEFRLYALLGQPLPCPSGLRCRLDASVNGHRQEEQQRIQTQLGITVSSQKQRVSLYTRYNYERTSADSHSIGIQWLRSLAPGVVAYSGLEYDQPQEPRAGDDRYSIHVGTRARPWQNLPLELQLMYLREYEQSAYSPAFWGNKRRDRRLTRLNSQYTWRLNPYISLKASAGWRHTDSPIELYQQDGWSTELTLIGTL
ncbi:hypothetical protein [Marinobacterium stanieri]|uniref:Tetratricopeptide repeat-containing protein n=1 Tax=Marinobacterium stanieri TaxID=49186 RepID=A0A1N6WCM7_9GAMM|nr:hypothetical protein [Marinobacterium stanieri]SIQ87788.1 hypothetical protein SAMN05421647_11083 [Marinobacterium stanieri]